MLAIIVTALFISLLLNIILKKFGLPTIIGYIITGTIISYMFGLHNVANNFQLKEVAEFGIVFLMFTIGLEFSVKNLKEMKYEVFVVGSAQILITALIVFILAYYVFSLSQYSALVISLAVAMSSTAIVLKTFNETGEINKQYGKNALGILIMQDIAVIPILIVIGVISSSQNSIENIMVGIVLGIVIIGVVLYVVGKYLLEPFLTQIIKTHSDELFIGSILFLAIAASYGAHFLGFSYSLGAFVAGMLIAETKYKHQAEADLVPFRDLLLGVFFITIGMQIKFDVMFEYAHIIVLLLFAIMFIKFSIIFLITRLSKKNNKRTSIKTAFSLIQIGEFALAILELARAHSLVDSPYGQVMTITIVLSMIMTPFILNNLSSIADLLIKSDTDEQQESMFSTSIRDHVVVLGYGEFGQNVAQKLKNDGEFYIVVENNPDMFHLAQTKHESVIFGNAANREILNKAYISRAKKIIIAIDNAKKLYLLSQMIQRVVHPDKVIIKIHSIREKKSLMDMGFKNIIVENEETSKEIINYI
ncbi:MAG: sodium:proton exchanger [Helicobacteraceae bacterium CG2_30_36_10]|nr:MAG: sodium:proton exchanger [Helicobacteraceae bacterium CG2_30_36_10]